MRTFAAIDFETANHDRASACAVGMVVVRRRRIVDRVYELIRPRTRHFEWTRVHGLTWQDVRGAGTFPDVWRKLRPPLRAVDFLVAHQASFDRSVLESCCRAYGLRPIRKPFVCTISLARRIWGVYPTTLKDVCAYLRLSLRHHHALSDAEACARIVIAAMADGWRPRSSEFRAGGWRASSGGRERSSFGRSGGA